MPNEKNQKAVAAILKELGISLNFSSKNERMIIQKAIYLSQAAGANLSYWFNWYLNGPYSSALADDYYEARTKLSDLEMYSASDSLREKLQCVKTLIAHKPTEIEEVQWLEALASLDYMKRVQRKPVTELVTACSAEKKHLENVLGFALTALKENGFLD